MNEVEIALARAYLAVSGQDPVTALIKSVKDLARVMERAAAGDRRGPLALLAPGPEQAGGGASRL